MFSPFENMKSDLYLHVCKQEQILQSSFERLVSIIKTGSN